MVFMAFECLHFSVIGGVIYSYAKSGSLYSLGSYKEPKISYLCLGYLEHQLTMCITDLFLNSRYCIDGIDFNRIVSTIIFHRSTNAQGEFGSKKLFFVKSQTKKRAFSVKSQTKTIF